jgi:hypothetical protein
LPQLKIGELLVQSGLISADDLDEALTAQLIYGGRLGTVLIEHDFVDEDELAEALARQHGMRRVTREHLNQITGPVIAAVPSSVALRFECVPFALDQERGLVWLAVAQPADLTRQDEMHFALGKPVEVALAPELLLKRALAKYYGLAHERRFIKLHTEGGRKRKKRAASAAHAILDAPQMLSLISKAATQGEVLDRGLDCMASFSEQAVLLTVDEAGLAGWASRGELALEGCASETRIAFDEAPQLRRLLAAKAPMMCSEQSDPALHSLLTGRLGLDAKGTLAILTLSVDDRTMGCFVLGCFRRDRNFDPALAAEVVVRLSWRMQALHLMDCVLSPLGGGR